MLLLDDIHKKHLELLTDLDEKVLKEFCRLSLEHLRKGNNPNEYQNAAQRLNLETDIVKNSINGLMHLFTEASKVMIPEIEFRDSIIALGFNEGCQEELAKMYLQNKEEIRSFLTTLNLNLPHYLDVDWRFDVQVASRGLRRPLEPKFLLNLQLEKESKKQNLLLETDAANLIHLTEVLEHALQEARSHHCRRIMRNVK